MKQYDRIIIGAGIYGLYAALYCAQKGMTVAILEYDDEAFGRATYVNQARVHMGYHYPRSLATATKSAGYFKRFVDDFEFCINKKFEQIYATSAQYSWTNAEAFQKFCDNVDIKCEEIPVSKYFNKNMCDGAFLTEEYTYDAMQLKKFFLDELKKYSALVQIYYNINIVSISRENDFYVIRTETEIYQSDYVLNATYASVNQILNLLEAPPFNIKYELCEIILCKVSENLEHTGLTVMDGPFFSVMPYGNTGYHSLTSVTFTPHYTSREVLPSFDCQRKPDSMCDGNNQLGNCNLCSARPQSAWNYMHQLARKYVKDAYKIYYEKSLFSMKPILKYSEVDDSRPTVIQYFSHKPTFVSVLSGKINTVYDLDDILEEK